MVGKDDPATREPAGLPHDRTPVAEQPFEISSAGSVSARDGCETFLGEVQQDVLWSLDLVIVISFHYARLVFCVSSG